MDDPTARNLHAYAERMGLSPQEALDQLLELGSRTADAADSKGAVQSDAVAVISMACRFPGGRDLEDYWALLCRGEHAITEVPKDRFDVDAYYQPGRARPGKMYSKHGGFIDRIYDFDAGFFALSKPQARATDPQQRLVLELAWQAMERAGVTAAQLNGSSTGVFIGVSNYDYGRSMSKCYDTITAYSGLGTIQCIAANHLSYHLNLRGPSMAVDTACSASLVSVHLACRSLLTGECDMAFAGGVNCILGPEVTIGFCRAGMVSRSGQCRTFDEAADGYVRSEGCGMVLLKRLADAVRDGDPIEAVILGSGVNHNGTSNGMSAPNGPAQVALMIQTHAQAGVASASIGYVEAHGTGTPLGDPIEFGSIKTVLTRDRERSRPCLIGSVKTNIGHLESAAGIAGFIKTALTVNHGAIPAHLHLTNLNRYMNLTDTPLKIPMELTPWPDQMQPRVAAVSSFGIGGTNAHVVVSQGPERERGPALARSLRAFTVSAKTEAALHALLMAYVAFLVREDRPCLADICHTATVGRDAFSFRWATAVTSTEQLQEHLEHAVRAGHDQFTRAKGWRGSRLAFWFGSNPNEDSREFVELMSGYPLLGEHWNRRKIGAHGDHAAMLALADFWFALGLAPRLCGGSGLPPDVMIGEGDDEYPRSHSASDFFGLIAEQEISMIICFGSPRDLVHALPSNCAQTIVSGMEVAASLAQLFKLGFDPRWSRVEQGAGARRVRLPTYPFQRKTFTMTQEDAPGINPE